MRLRLNRSLAGYIAFISLLGGAATTSATIGDSASQTFDEYRPLEEVIVIYEHQKARQQGIYSDQKGKAEENPLNPSLNASDWWADLNLFSIYEQQSSEHIEIPFRNKEQEDLPTDKDKS